MDEELVADANHNLAVIVQGGGDALAALPHFQRALQTQPGHWQYWISYADALLLAGQLDSAADVLEAARLAGLPTDLLDEMIQHIVTTPVAALSVGATHAPASDIVLLTQLLNQGRFADMQHAALRMVEARPNDPFAWRMLAIAHQAQDHEAAAIEPLRQLVRLQPCEPDGWYKLGLAHNNRGQLVGAEVALRRTVGLDAGHVDALCNLGMVAHRRGKLQQAMEWLVLCTALDAQHAVAWVNSAVVLGDLGQTEQASEHLQRALQIQPDLAHAHNMLGYLQKEQGQVALALASIEQALRLEPDNRAAHSNRLFVLNYHPDKCAEEIFAAYQQFDRCLGEPQHAAWRAHGNDRNPRRRLRVGYVCPSFCKHSTRHFLLPLLEHHDHQRFELFAYAEVLQPTDPLATHYRALFEHWTVTNALSDAALAQHIRDDGIDVLIDIAGHTRGNRLGAMAYKPAPVSMHWLDFGYTTGLCAIDHYLTDWVTVPPGSEHLFAEAPWRLPVPALVYRPGPGMGEAGVLPALQRGFVTFGSLTRSIRINRHVVRAWAELLRRVEGSRLVVDSGNFATPEAAQALAGQFAAQGVAPGRLSIGCHSPPWDVMRGIDIGLDCFPHNSGTTLFEMLYLGIPFVTLAGRPSVGRIGSAILQGVGEPGWIATTAQDYVGKLAALAADLPALARTRQRLRSQMQASPLMDEAGFARQVEDAFVQMFERWSQAQDAAESVTARSPAVPVPEPMPQPGVGSVADLQPLVARAAQQAMELGLRQHRAGDLDAAAELYRGVLGLVPTQQDANHNLAVILLGQGHAKEAVERFRQVHLAQPGHWQYWLSYFDGLLLAGDRHGATQLLEHRRRLGLEVAVVQELVQRVVDARLSAAATPALAHTTARPSPQAFARIDSLFKANRMDEVVTLARAMTRKFPQVAYGWKALGAAWVNRGEFGQALQPLQKAVAVAPADAGALSNLGFALHNQRRPVEAEVNLRLALQLRPGFAAALINLGSAVLGQDRYAEAAELYQQGLAIEPDYIPAHSHLAQVRDEQVRLVEAAAGFRRTLELLRTSTLDLRAARFDITQAHAHQGLASVMAKLSDFHEVVAQSDAALAVLPEDPVLWEKRLYAFSYHPDLPVADIFAEFVRWGDRFALPAADFGQHDRTVARRLRVGYVSPDFRQHTSRFYFLPFFANHDHSVVEIFAYSNVKVEDAFTAKFRAVFDHWRDIRELGDDEVAELVRSDGIDILVDGCNHMRDDRLGVFTKKPAPLQVTWLGAAWTTGLSAVDYVLFDPLIAPPETIARENIVRLPHCFVPFQSMVQTDLPAPPPCLTSGTVTFAYSGRTERLNHHTFRVWGEILRRLPNARLVLDFRSFADPLNRDHFRALMQRHGLGPQRVEMRNSSDIFKALHDFDILLDCFPHSGGTMLVDALWMGVPVLTLAARPPLGRIGTSFVSNIGLADWVAHSEQEYIDKACSFAADPQALALLRAGMRERMLGSPLMDGVGFARGVEAAYRTMWERFCAGEKPAPITVAPVPAQGSGAAPGVAA